MKNKSLAIVLLFTAIIVIVPLIVSVKNNLDFNPVIFVNEWYKFSLNLVVIFTSFSLIYLFWGKHQKNNLFLATKEIIVGLLESILVIVEECTKKMDSSDNHEIIRTISLRIKTITPLQKSLQKFLSNPLVMENKKIYFFLTTFFEKQGGFLEYLSTQELISIDDDFKKQFYDLSNKIETLKNNIGAVNE